MADQVEKIFGDVLKETRKKAGISQEKLALDSDLDRTFISMLERGIKQPTLSTVLRLANALNIKASDIVMKIERRYED